MNQIFYAFHTNSFFGGPVNIDIYEYQNVRTQFQNYWREFNMMSSLVFDYIPYSFNPFEDVLYTSKGRYDIANHYNGFGPNFLFVSDRMLEIFKSLNIPEYQLFPIKYRQKGNIYNGYFLAFLQDYSKYIDFDHSKICYKPYGHDYFHPVKFRSSGDMLAFINENASIKHPNGATNLGDFRFPEIKFQQIVYEMDLLCVPFLITTFIVSNKLKQTFENEKIKNIQFFDVMGTHYSFDNGILILDPNAC